MDNPEPQPVDAAKDNSAASVDSPPAEPTPLPLPEIGTKSQLAQWFGAHGTILALLTLTVFIVGLLVFLRPEQHDAVKQFTNVYSFVPEKISQSAAIQVSLPDGVDEETAQQGITFSPEIAGSWQEEELEKTLVYVPNKPLRKGVYYAVNMDTGSLQMSGDFYVDEDPQIEAIFPAKDVETPEDTEITIVFNRPMVPLTTLDMQEEVELPITITPETPGRYKWISSRTLQFIPETTLIPASQYKVVIADGFVSLDGLPVAARDHEFFTRPLRYEYITDDVLSYRRPIVINFNQAVDLDETAKKIEVKHGEDRAAIDIEYGDRTYYDYDTRKTVTEADPSRLFVYQKKDQHGRQQLWDFDTTYFISINGATPLFGNTTLEESRTATVQVPDVVKSITAQSERADQVRPEMFDPQGTITVEFYEPIDLKKSSIDVRGLREIVYGERCQTDEDGDTVYIGSGCAKVDDHSTLIFSFDDSKLGRGESVPLELRKLVTTDGLRVNAKTITLPLTTYPTFEILRTRPNGNGELAPVNVFAVCSNTPLKIQDAEGAKQSLQTDGYIVYGRWPSSYLVNRPQVNDPCRSGEYRTNITVGLLPDTQYSLKVALTDAFDQTADQQMSFTTESPKEHYTRFNNMQKQYNVTPPGRTTLTYSVENLEYIDMHICKMSPETFLEQTVVRASETDAPSDTGCTDVQTRRIELPNRYWVANYFQVNLADFYSDSRGHYIVTFSHPRYVKNVYQNRQTIKRQRYDRTYVSVTNLAVGRKEVEYSTADQDAWMCKSDDCPWHKRNIGLLKRVPDTDKNLYWVNNSQSLTPTAGALVTQYRYADKTFSQAGIGFADAQGVARTAVADKLVGAVIKGNNGESAVVTDWADSMQSVGETRDASRTYIYTDRPIYRPGHTVEIRGIDRIGFDGSYEIWNKEPVELKVFDAQNAQVYDAMLPVSSYGTFDTSFEIPADAPLGTYRIEVFGNRSYFSVEEYVPAAFKLEAETNKEEYLNGDTLKLDVQADYYFGVPLDAGTVTYSVTAQDYHFDRYTDEYFNFGRGWYSCYSCGYGDDFLFRGKADINEVGRAVIEGSLDLSRYYDDLASEGSKLVTVSLTAQDIGGRSVSVQKSFIVHKGEFYLGAKTDRYYTGTNNPVTFRVKSVDTKGQPIPLSSIERTVSKITWDTFKRKEVDGGYYYRSEKRVEEISVTKLKTDNNGDASEQLTFAEPGRYEVKVSKTDERGNVIETVTSIYIYGSGVVQVPPNNNYELDIEVEQPNVEVGDAASILIKSPYERAKVLITAERGTVYDYWVADVTDGLYLHEFPITNQYAPNIFVSALLLSPDPEVKHGSVRFEVGSVEHELQVEVEANKTHYLPGEQVTLSVSTKDGKGRPVPAEVSLAVADLSVLALKGNPKKNPAVFFFDGFPLSVSTASNIKNILYEVDIPLGTKGGGGGDPEDLAKKKRGVFKDTAFWEASVVTDGAGRATVSFTLPDNLTTWQIESLGVTKDTKLGVDYAEFTTKKDLMAVPLKPRFVVPGDKFSLGAKIFNQTERGTTVTVKLESDTLNFLEETIQEVFISPSESKTVYVEVEAPGDMKAGAHNFTFTASDETFEDSVEQTIAITPNSTYETVATANFTTNETTLEYIYVPNVVLAGEGGLTINANATLTVFMEDALSYMAVYPYGCSEQLSSALATIATVKAALDLPNVEGELTTIEFEGVEYTVDEVVEQTLERIYEAQRSGGGFGYYPGVSSASGTLSAHILIALAQVKKAGYAVREDVLKNAAQYVARSTANISISGDNWSGSELHDKERVTMMAYSLQQVGYIDGGVSARIGQLANDKAYLNEYSSSASLAYLALVVAGGEYSQLTQNRVYDALTNRIDIDGRGAYVRPGASRNWHFYERTESNTALLLKVFAAYDDEHQTMANVLRWLLASRDKRGVWGSTHSTYTVVDAMVDYQRWQKETESNFTLTGLLNKIKLFDYEFAPANIFSTYTHKVPMDDLPREQLVPLAFEKVNHNAFNNNLYYDVTLKYYLPVEQLPARDEGITITRELYNLRDDQEENPLSTAVVGEVVKGKITLTTPAPYNHIAIEDIIPAGFEIVNFNLDTEAGAVDALRVGQMPAESNKSWLSSLFGQSQTAQLFRSRGFVGQYGNTTRKLYPTHVESHDDRVFVYVEDLRAGVYEYEYYLRALVPGEFQHLPARAEQLYLPEVFGRTNGEVFTITPAE